MLNDYSENNFDSGDMLPGPSYNPHPTPPPRVVEDDLYIPYRYTIDEEECIFNIHTRSRRGVDKKTIALDVHPWSYLKIKSGSDDPVRTVEILKDELSTRNIKYSASIDRFVVEPTESVTTRVKECCSEITNVPLTPFSVLSRFNHRFFDYLKDDGRWAKNGPTSATPKEAHTVFNIVTWCVIDDNTLAFVTKKTGHFDDDKNVSPGELSGYCMDEGDDDVGDDAEDHHQRYGGGMLPLPSSARRSATSTINESHDAGRKVHIWTTYPTFAGSDKVAASIGSLFQTDVENCVDVCMPEARSDEEAQGRSRLVAGVRKNHLDVNVRIFSSSKDIQEEFSDFLSSDIDITVHYGENTGPLSSAIIKNIQEVKSLEVLDLQNYVTEVYTDMPSHDFFSVVNEIDVKGNNDYVTKACFASLAGMPPTLSIPDIERTVHSEENITFFIEKITAKAYLLSRLFKTLSTSIYDLCYHSGCNMSDLTKRETASRGIVTFFDPIVAWSQIVDTLPGNFMGKGVTGLTYVVPFSSLLIEAMRESSDGLTASIGEHILSLGAYGWIIREIYSMKALSPNYAKDIPSIFGIHRGMVYSSSPIENVDNARQWSSIINVGLESWIGISITPPNTPVQDSEQEYNNSISYGYFGIEKVCRHPFDALRSAVEMFLSLKIINNSNASPKTVAITTTLTPENMAMKRRVTASNISMFSSYLPKNEIARLKAGDEEVILNLWYKTKTTLTTNPLLADKRVYQNIIEKSLVDAFGKVMDISSSSLLRSNCAEDPRLIRGGEGSEYHRPASDSQTVVDPVVPLFEEEPILPTSQQAPPLQMTQQPVISIDANAHNNRRAKKPATVVVRGSIEDDSMF